MNLKKIVIFGAGRAGRDVLQLIEQINKYNLIWDVIGFVDNNSSLQGLTISGVKVFGSFEAMNEKSNNIFAITANQIPKIRKKIINDEIKANSLKLASLVHPSIDVPDDCKISEGCVLFPGVFIAKNVSLGSSVIINYNTLLGIDLNVGDFSFIGPSVTITGSCSIGECTIIGAGCLFAPGVKIGSYCLIGFGSKVFDHVEDSKNVFDFPRKLTRDNMN